MQILRKKWLNNTFLHPHLKLALPPRGNPVSVTGNINLKILITGRNEVLAKVIFSQASVILFKGGFSKFSGGSPNFRGGGLQIFGGSPIFRGEGFSKFWGGSPNFWGVLQIFGGGLQFFRGVSKFSGGLQIFGGFSKFSQGSPIFGGVSTGIRSTFGRYASYWNAFLSQEKIITVSLCLHIDYCQSCQFVILWRRRKILGRR